MMKNRFLRRIVKSAWLVTGAASLAALVVFFLVSNRPEKFTARATICICPATGLLSHQVSAEHSVDARIGNLKTILMSREVLERTSIRLLAGNLLQNMPGRDTKGSESHYRLLSEVPPEILALVERSGTEELLPDQGNEPPEDAPADSIDAPVYYTIRAGDTPDGVCSRFGITLATLQALNVPMPPFQGGKRLVVGSKRSGPIDEEMSSIGEEASAGSGNVGPTDELPPVDCANDNRVGRLEAYLTAYLHGDRMNFLEGLLASDDPVYGIHGLSGIKAARLKGSDMVRLTFSSADPFMGAETLRILLEVLNERLGALKPEEGAASCRLMVAEKPFPVDPDTGLAGVAAVIAFFSVLLLSLAMALLVESGDRTIKTPARMERMSGLILLGCFPKILPGTGSRPHLAGIASRSVDFITRRIFIESFRAENGGEQPFVLLIVSSAKQQGKTYLAGLITQKLRASGSRVIFITPAVDMPATELARQFTSFDVSGKSWDYEYTVPDNIAGIRDVNELIRNFAFIPAGCRFLIIELPALQNAQFPVLLARSANLSLMVARATATWSTGDSEAVRLYQTAVQHPVMGLLNYCEPDFIV